MAPVWSSMPGQVFELDVDFDHGGLFWPPRQPSGGRAMKNRWKMQLQVLVQEVVARVKLKINIKSEFNMQGFLVQV